MNNIFKNTNLFTLITKFLVIILPFYVIIKVFFEVKLGIPSFGFFIKEFLVLILFVLLVFYYIKDKKLPKFDAIDYLIFGYFAYGIFISLANGLGFNAIFYGGRYDFIFFVVFLIFRHSKDYLKISFENLIKLFLLSASISLFFGLIIKFTIGEEVLELFGYSIYVADWQFKGGIPIYHGVEASGLRRFQGLLDSPNAMGFFLIMFSGLYLHLNKKITEFHNIIVFIILIVLIVTTYSRSALLGVFSAVSILFLLNIKTIYKNHKKELGYSLLLLSIFGIIFYVTFQSKIDNIILRSGSTKGHFDRMGIGIERFIEAPFGQGLATAGPAFRAIETGEITKQKEEYYIPESWFIQQLIEGGIIYFSLFISIFIGILLRSYKKSKAIFGSIIAIIVMNIFLHSFEATYLSILLFIFIGILLNDQKIKN